MGICNHFLHFSCIKPSKISLWFTPFKSEKCTLHPPTGASTVVPWYKNYKQLRRCLRQFVVAVSYDSEVLVFLKTLKFQLDFAFYFLMLTVVACAVCWQKSKLFLLKQIRQRSENYSAEAGWPWFESKHTNSSCCTSIVSSFLFWPLDWRVISAFQHVTMS